MTIVARVLGAQSGADLYVARYANCFRGRSEWNVHAEEFMLTDPQLLALLRGADAGGDRAGILQLYMSYQPCHHSGGRLPEAKTPEDAVSSSSSPQGVRTRGTRRAARSAFAPFMWTEDLMIERAPDDGVRSSTYCADAASARQGILLMVANAPGVTKRSTSGVTKRCDE